MSPEQLNERLNPRILYEAMNLFRETIEGRRRVQVSRQEEGQDGVCSR